MTTDTTNRTYDRARRLIAAATGDEYGDGCTVTGIGVGIVEPGYGDRDTVWATGDWNPKRFRHKEDPPLTLAESRPVRLADALDRQGVALLWLDEWTECRECWRVFRVAPDSYSWQMYGAFCEDGPICAECFRFEDIANEAINNPRYVIRRTLLTREQLEEEGFAKHNGQYENGWYPGQDDDPTQILEAMRHEYGDAVEVVFYLDGVGQFDIEFSAWCRVPGDD